jgi:hypothetical protein
MDANTCHQVELSGFEVTSVRFGRVAASEHLPDLPIRWQPLAARVFAEQLIFCSDDEAARRLVRGDPVGAAAFSEVLIVVDGGVHRGEIPTAVVSPQGSLPFYFLVTPVLSFLDTVQIEFPHKYEDT